MKWSILFIVLLLMPFVMAEASTKANPSDELRVPALRVLGILPTDDVTHCYAANESYAVYHNGLWWAWLAPVATSGWGATPDASLMGDGWRNVVDETEWALRPEATTFSNADKCAARTFFSGAPWCDWNDPYYIDGSHPNGYLTYYIDGSVSEFWVVHDDCGNEVPEFGLIATGLALIGALGIIVYAKRH